MNKHFSNVISRSIGSVFDAMFGVKFESNLISLEFINGSFLVFKGKSQATEVSQYFNFFSVVLGLSGGVGEVVVSPS